jgi:hypothetical protein
VVRIKVLQQEHPNQDEQLDVKFEEDGAALVAKVLELRERLEDELKDHRDP